VKVRGRCDQPSCVAATAAVRASKQASRRPWTLQRDMHSRIFAAQQLKRACAMSHEQCHCLAAEAWACHSQPVHPLARITETPPSRLLWSALRCQQHKCAQVEDKLQGHLQIELCRHAQWSAAPACKETLLKHTRPACSCAGAAAARPVPKAC
jgi:hypothetical protein